jgi:serine protease Do
MILLGRFARWVVVGIVLAALLAGSGCQFLPSLDLPRPSPPWEPRLSPQPASSSGNAAMPINPSWTPPLMGAGSAPGVPSFADVVKKAQPAVVSIQTETTSYDIFLQPVPREGAGSGVIIDERGYVVTNAHVVAGAKTIKVTLADGRTFDALKVNTDAQADLAVVEIQGDNLPVATLGRSENLSVGDWVVAIGNALALEGGPTVTAGIVSYTGRSIQVQSGVTLYNLIQTDAAINPGNSGGALLNLAAEVVGINTAIAGEAQNIGFAIAITPAMPVIEQLIKFGRVTRAWLGVTLITVTPSIVSSQKLRVTEGVLLTAVVRGSPAENAGLKAGDVIIRFAGEKITKAEQLRQVIQGKRPGERVEIVYVRGDQQATTQATLVESPNR